MARAACVAIVALLLSGPSHAQNWPSARVQSLADWLQAVRAHEPGSADSALYTLASYRNDQLRTLWLDVQALMRFVHCARCAGMAVRGLDGRTASVLYAPKESAALHELAGAIAERRDDDELLKRAAILHADVVMLAKPEGEPRAEAPPPPGPRGYRSQPPVPDRVILQSRDGRQEKVITDAVHWDIAYALLDRIPNGADQPAPQLDATVRLWYRATIEYLQNTAMHDQMHFTRALRLFPDDAEVQFQNGCLHESLASARVQTVMRSMAVPTGYALSVKGERPELETAERFFRRALELTPSHPEARLRLGRTLGLLGRHDQAAAELRAVPDNLDHVALRYYTALFLGREEEALGHRDAAQAAYERAGAIFPLAQSPQIALSHLAREGGDRERALASAQRVLDLPLNEVDRRDPFWVYHFIEGRHVDDLLAELYAPFRHGPRAAARP